MSGISYLAWSRFYPKKRLEFLKAVEDSQSLPFEELMIPVPFTGAGFADAYSYLEDREGAQLKWMFMTARNWDMMRRFGRDILDMGFGPETATLWGAAIILERSMPEDEVVFRDSEKRLYRFKLVPELSKENS